MRTTLLILPHQLYRSRYLPKNKKTEMHLILWEHPQYFTKYRYNQKRILMHRASLRYYYDYLKEKGYRVEYCEYKKRPKLTVYQVFDPIDKLRLPGQPVYLPSPNFLLAREDYNEYREKTKSLIFNNFYLWGKRRLNLLPGIKSQDKDNRHRLEKKTKIPQIPTNRRDQSYIEEAVKYTQKHFSDNYGTTDDFIFPISHGCAKYWLKHFIKNRFKNFGKYQDALTTRHEYLFHSLLSTSINLGLLQPQEVIDEVMKYRKKVPLNSLEGFIRQLFWREYQRFCYIYATFKGNYFNHKKSLTKKWYTGELGIKPVDDAIKKAFRTGYLHHIERLMVIGNFMNLSEIKPRHGFRWFMEFSCDSYEWVMHQNVYDMAFFANENQSMRRPYLSSSNYILKMSDYPKEEWVEEWNDLYYAFLKKHRQKLWKYRYYFGGLKMKNLNRKNRNKSK